MEHPLKKLWLYNNWANMLVIENMLSNSNEVPAKCLLLLSHIINTQMIWTSRMNGDEPTVGVWDTHTLQECQKYHNGSAELLLNLIIDYHSHGRIIQYTNSKNLSFENSLEDILLHIFNHGTYHRAQIATEMRRNGFEPLNTDYITHKRLSF